MKLAREESCLGSTLAVAREPRGARAVEACILRLLFEGYRVMLWCCWMNKRSRSAEPADSYMYVSRNQVVGVSCHSGFRLWTTIDVYEAVPQSSVHSHGLMSRFFTTSRAY